MNLGQILAKVRNLNASPLPTRWTNQLLIDNINDASVQLAIDANYPSATQIWLTNPPPGAPAVVYTGAAGVVEYQYALSTVARVPASAPGSTGGDSAPGTVGASPLCIYPLDADDYNTLTFSTVQGTIYKVLRMINGIDTAWQYIGQVTGTGTNATFTDNGLPSQPYLVRKGNEFELPPLAKIQRVYLQDAAGDTQPLVPNDLDTLAGIVSEVWDQSSALQAGAPQFTPQYLAEVGTAYPVPSPFARPNLTAPYQFAATGVQRPTYYMRGGFLGVLPPPITFYTVLMDYIPFQPPLSQLSDPSVFPDNFKDALAYKVMEYIAISDEKGTEDSMRQRYNDEVKRQTDLFTSSIQGDKPRSQDPNTIRTEMRGWEL